MCVRMNGQTVDNSCHAIVHWVLCAVHASAAAVTPEINRSHDTDRQTQT